MQSQVSTHIRKIRSHRRKWQTESMEKVICTRQYLWGRDQKKKKRVVKTMIDKEEEGVPERKQNSASVQTIIEGEILSQ